MSVNKAIIVGYLGRDPDTKFTAGGMQICGFSIATSEKYRNKQGEKVEETTWHNCTAFGKLAEICWEYLKKGSLVYVEGRMQLQTWEKDGVEKSATKIIVNEMRMLGGKGEKAPDKAETDENDVPF